MDEGASHPSDDEKTTGWRGSRELWLAAAKKLLVESGLDAVKILPLAKRLQLSRTSFYWFFTDREALLDALLDDWEAKNTGAFVAAAEAPAETVTAAILELIGVFLDETRFEPQLDFAVRGWAHASDAVAARVNATDERRLAAIRSIFTRFGAPEDEADVRARTVYLTQIGYIAMQVRETREVRLGRVARYVEIFTGRTASREEIVAFAGRLGALAEPRDG